MVKFKKGNIPWNKGFKRGDNNIWDKVIDICHNKTREKAKLGLWKTNLGKKASPETIKKLSEAHKGQLSWNKGNRGFKWSEEQKLKLSKIAKEKGFGKWMIGKTSSIETKEKQSKNNRKYWMGKQRTKETVNKIKLARSKQIMPIKERFMKPLPPKERWAGGGQ